MQILIKPIVTEKLNDISEKLNRFGFVVKKDANKLQIKKAVEEMYNVTVEGVNTMNYAGKVKSRYTKSGVQVGKTAAYKKAIVTLAEGDKIDFYSNI
ncbi:50S ribosomal protein L23 [Saccharicrinis fermentans]|uniref:Large ribosomal subunit protein uL23 n=1 Tax=Saccharicrinis fermentans DSM 9555 = JCM 21142 TaxID=869213 RepID=W7YJV1_9BACT|nr:50S ribosomal protein L23 [Saccharicrinis fermentans]GAF02609.1 50S ribosomal protein L23 [Saccharicrinis fermentans DSM 9555 = JCM 21142]